MGRGGGAGAAPPPPPVHSGLGVLEGEADLEGHLVVPDLAVLHVSADLGDLEPPDLAHRLRGALDGPLDRVVHALLGRPDDLGLPVDVVRHWGLLVARGARSHASSNPYPLARGRSHGHGHENPHHTRSSSTSPGGRRGAPWTPSRARAASRAISSGRTSRARRASISPPWTAASSTPASSAGSPAAVTSPRSRPTRTRSARPSRHRSKAAAWCARRTGSSST